MEQVNLQELDMNLDKLSKKKMTQMKLEIKEQLENKELLKLSTSQNSQHTCVSTFASHTSPSTDQSLQKSFHLSHADKIELKKISSPSENKKYPAATDFYYSFRRISVRCFCTSASLSNQAVDIHPLLVAHRLSALFCFFRTLEFLS